jgi:hypothetical protein
MDGRKWLKRMTNGYTKGYGKRLPGVGDFEEYRIASNNCNDFTDAALDEYLGYDWCWEIITGAEDLIQQWDERFTKDGYPRDTGWGCEISWLKWLW